MAWRIDEESISLDNADETGGQGRVAFRVMVAFACAAGSICSAHD
jgi:hypothetical protein